MSRVSLARGINDFKAAIDAPIASYFSSCVHCGLCAEACLFYVETGDPKYTPIRKLEPMRRIWEQEYTLFGKLKKALGWSKPVTDDELEEWKELLYASCTMCGRCSQVCPVGNDIAYMVKKAREGMVSSGHAPEELVGAANRAVKIGSPMGVKLPAVLNQIKHIEADTGLKIPLDVQGADYMALLSSMEIINFPEYLGALAKIFKQAGVSWTVATEAFEATNAGHQIGSSDIERELVQRVVTVAEKLNVKVVIGPECGHAFNAIRWDGPELIGRPYKFRVLHIIEVLDQLRAEGKLKVDSKVTEKLTFHDPCNMARKSGIVQQQRNLLGVVATNFVEMPDSGIHNWCCGGGGGANSMEEYAPLRAKAFGVKRRQIEAVEPELLVTACANCRLTFEEGLEHYKIEIPLAGLTEMIAEHLKEDESAA
jgi:Fe-S oxidoreductase